MALYQKIWFLPISHARAPTNTQMKTGNIGSISLSEHPPDLPPFLSPTRSKLTEPAPINYQEARHKSQTLQNFWKNYSNQNSQMFGFQNSFKIHPIITNLSKNFILLRLARGLLNTKYLSASTDLFYHDIYLHERHSKCELLPTPGHFCLMIPSPPRLGRDPYNDEFSMFING